MKTLTFAFLLLAIAHTARGDGELRGTVLQVIPGVGVLIDGAYKTERTDKASNVIYYNGPFLLTGYRDEVNEGAPIQGRAIENGMYSYVTALGAERTIHALAWTD